MTEIFADHCVHGTTIRALQSSGFNVLAAAEVRLAAANDLEIFDAAQKYKRVLLTFDRGLGNFNMFPIGQSYGVVVVLVTDRSKEQVAADTLSFFQKFPENQFHNTLFIIDQNRVRIRKEFRKV